MLVRAARCLGLGGEARVAVLTDPQMSQAHERHAGVPGTTDVLTFDLRETGESGETGPGGPQDVDLLICLDEALRQGAARGHAPRLELLLYALHGLLHCAGHDDHTEPAAALMHAEEDRVLTAIGVGAVYATRADGADGAVGAARAVGASEGLNP